MLLQLNILCTGLEKPSYTKSNNSPVIHHSHVTPTLRVLKCIEFRRSGVIHMLKCSLFNTLSGVIAVF